MPTDKPDVMEHFLKLNNQHRTTIELTMMEGLLLTRLAEASLRMLAGKSPINALVWVSRLGSVSPEITFSLATKLDALHKTARQQFGDMLPSIIEHAIEDVTDG